MLQLVLEWLKAALMGIVEGITEWLPISSTGHMILLEQLIKFNASEEFISMFRVVIQLGAILAVVVLFWSKLWPFGVSPKTHRIAPKKETWTLWLKIVVATLPVLAVSPLDNWFEAHFYNAPSVAAALILYGVLFILVERKPKPCRVQSLAEITYKDALIIGLWQVLAIIPGTSRSGATILGGLLLGLSRGAVAEFTFYLAIPVMAGASLLKTVKYIVGGAALGLTEAGILVIGCVVAFVVSLGVIRFLMDYVKKHTFTAFGVYRIALGALVLLVAAFTPVL
ncbi:MAG: undecaprenyl-diphosphate phosphatase [Pygmaiobacter sp.]|nr:undecaprenyl-diphosphate phosphatase [Pygmaiobacter sp.]